MGPWCEPERPQRGNRGARARGYVGTIPKCGGKSSCFEKPGPASPFKQTMRNVAQQRAAAAAEEGGELFRAIEEQINKHPSAEWRQRAMRDFARLIRAAADGTPPGLVPFTCHSKRHGGAEKKAQHHHVLCKDKGKSYKEDERVVSAVLLRLRERAPSLVEQQLRVANE